MDLYLWFRFDNGVFFFVRSTGEIDDTYPTIELTLEAVPAAKKASKELCRNIPRKASFRIQSEESVI